MERAISLKVRVEDLAETEGKLFDLTDSLGTAFQQTDVYFRATNGTLKLRIMTPSPCGQLISTALLASDAGKRLIENTTTPIEDVALLRDTLSRALGEVGTVEKHRRVFSLEDARIYLDDIKEIGKFVEILVPTTPEDDEKNQKRAEQIASDLGFTFSNFIPLSYIELGCSNIRYAQRS